LHRSCEWQVSEVQNVAYILIDPEGSLDKRDHWERTSHAMSFLSLHCDPVVARATTRSD